MDAMFIESQPAMPRTNGTPNPRRIELYAGRGRKEGTAATRDETCIPNGSSSGKYIPESSFGMGYSFQMNG